MSSAVVLKNMPRIRNLSSFKRTFTAGKIIYNKPSSSGVSADVPGLSSNVVNVPNEPVGPGASKQSKNYKNPEYFCYDKNSYFEAEVEMNKFRLPQPSVKQYYQPTSK